MANEIRVNVQVSVVKNGISLVSFNPSVVYALTGVQSSVYNQVVGTSNEQLVFPADQIAEGISGIIVWNIDATNYCDVYQDGSSANVFARLQPKGLPMILPSYTITAAGSPAWYAKAHTNPTTLAIAILGIT